MDAKDDEGAHRFGGDVALTTLHWNGAFIALVCGNFSLPAGSASALLPAPVPTIAGAKFNDLNKNGVRDPGEPGVDGVTFNLLRVSSEFHDQSLGYVTTTQSAPDGTFAFRLDGMGPGTYRVQEVPTAGWVNTTPLTQDVAVLDGEGATVHTVSFGNRLQRPPVAKAGPDQFVDATSTDGALVTLDGTGSYDPDGDDPLTYRWTWRGHTATTATPQVQLPVGTSTVTLTVTDALGAVSAQSDDVQITVYPPITVTAQDIGSQEGQQFEGTVAAFIDPDPQGQANEYKASIDWGDGTPSCDGAITKADDGTFTVTGDHVYAEEGTYHPTATVTDDDNPFNTDSTSSTATVADAPLTAAGVDTLSTNPVDGVVATFTDANPHAPVSDFTATIDWGDGSAATAGTVSATDNGTFTVSGSHTYATLGPKTILVHIVDEGGQTADATSHVLLYALASGGDFVIGDQNAVVGNAVTYWGAQWWRANTLSGGLAPAAFKGFENQPAGSTSLIDWTTDPGNSSNPPASVPSYMAVIVSTSIGQSGSTISGDAPHIVIVETDPGYQGNPGHDGTGTVVAVLR